MPKERCSISPEIRKIISNQEDKERLFNMKNGDKETFNVDGENIVLTTGFNNKDNISLNHRDLLKKYLQFVGEEEGFNFLPRWYNNHPFISQEEYEELCKLDEEIRMEQNQFQTRK